MLSGDAQFFLTGVATLSLATSVGLAVKSVRTPQLLRDAFDAAGEALRSIDTPPDDPTFTELLDRIDTPANPKGPQR